MNCFNAVPSVWGNPTRMCISSKAGLQSFWGNVKTLKIQFRQFARVRTLWGMESESLQESWRRTRKIKKTM